MSYTLSSAEGEQLHEVDVATVEESFGGWFYFMLYMTSLTLRSIQGGEGTP